MKTGGDMGAAGRYASTAILACALLLAGNPRSSFAGHPFGTEDAGTQGTGTIEVEFNGDRVEGSDGTRVDTPGTVLTVGIAPKFDVVLVWSYDFERAADGTTERSPGPFQALLKTALVEGRGKRPTVAIEGGISLPAVEGEQFVVPVTLVAEWEFDPVTVFANIGDDIGTRLAGNEDASSRLRGSIAGSLALRKDWFLLSELLWEKEASPSRPSSTEWLIGARHEFTDTLALNTGVRWGLTAQSPHVTYLVGITLGFRGWGPEPAADPGRP
jgi:hypothetical protein